MVVGSQEYNRRVGFEREADDARDEFNEPVSGWVRIGETYAKRVDTKDMEKLSAGQEMSALSARFTVRSTAVTRALTPAHRMVLSGVWNAQGKLVSGEVWDIDGVKEVPGKLHAQIEITGVLNRENQVQG